MHSIEKDTLGYQLKSRPGTIYRDMSDLPFKQVAGAVKQYMDAHDLAYAKPEVEAIWFYMTNHAVAEVRQMFGMDEPLGEFLPLVEDYQRMLSEKAVRMFYYILLITTRESRHLHSGNVKDKLEDKYGESFSKFQGKLNSKGSDGAASYMQNHPPEIKLGPYCDALTYLFNEGGFSGGYGGKPWGAVAHCIREFVYGRYSAEMMMDTAFTLCHNNGPIFNKGMLYETYNKSAIVKILDVQRSGQIPQLVESKSVHFVNSDHDHWHQKAKALLGAKFGGYVDWYLVEALGSMSHYPTEKDDQKNAHGEPPSVQKAVMAAEKKKLQQEMAAAAQKAEEEKHYLTIMPGIKVKKIERKAA